MDVFLSVAAAFLGAATSMLFEFFPGIKQWHEKLPPKKKALLHTIVTFVIALGILWLSCAEWFASPLGLTCTKFNTANIFLLFLAAFSGNQGNYLAFVKFRPKGDGAKG